MSYISASLRKLVGERAQHCCEYCHFPIALSLLAFEMEHIIPEKHGGATTPENLALSCPYCNRAKGSDVASYDPLTSKLTPLFNPRTQRWADHFRQDGVMIKPLTDVGRVTVFLLQLNHPDRLRERSAIS